MPFAGFICEISGAQVSPEHCIGCAMQGGEGGCAFTPPLLRGIAAANRPRGYTGWSATQLTACPRKVRLEARHPWYARPSALYWAWRGTVGHAAVEGAHGLDDVVAEVRFAARLNGALVSGTPDVVYVGRRHLQDYKTTKAVPGPWYVYTCPACGETMQEGRWKVRRGHTKTCPHCGARHGPQALRGALREELPRPYGGHVAQVSVYRWLLHHNGIAVDTAEIVYLDMEQARRLAVDLWSLEYTQAWIAGRLPALAAPELPPALAADDDDAWQCTYCPVAGVCHGPA